VSFPHDVEVGFAQLLTGAGLGVYHLDGSAYAASDLGITHRRLSDQPTRQISLAYYPVTSDPGQAIIQGAVQVRSRGTEDPSDVDSIADAAYVILHGLDQVSSNGVYFGHIWRQSGSSLGADNTGRWQWTDNYYFWSARQTNTLTD